MIKKTICFLLLTATYAHAEEVKMLTTPPTVEDLQIMLGGKKDSAPASRSIWGKKNTSNEKPTSGFIGMPIEFAYNSDKISPESKDFVDILGKAIKELGDGKFLIEGHTDAKGSDEYNEYLSERRAEAIKNYLINNYALNSKQFISSGKGEYSPLSGTDPYDAKNRRVQVMRLE